MEISLLRHGIAAEIGGKIKTDAERPLTDEGIKDMKLEARGMDNLKMAFTAILTSPVLRARQTAEIVADVLKCKDILKVTDALAIPPSRTALMSELRQFQKDDHILLVGHEPNMSELTAFFLGHERLRFTYKKGSLCKIELTRMTPTPRGELKWFITPKQLRLLGAL